MKTIIAIYQDGVFRPIEPVDLPEHSRVRVEVEASSTPDPDELAQQEIYRLMGLRFESGDPFRRRTTQ